MEQNTVEVPADREGYVLWRAGVQEEETHREVAKVKSDMISKLDEQEGLAEHWRGTEETKAEDHVPLDAEEEQSEALEPIDSYEADHYHFVTMTRRLGRKTLRRKHMCMRGQKEVLIFVKTAGNEWLNL